MVSQDEDCWLHSPLNHVCILKGWDSIFKTENTFFVSFPFKPQGLQLQFSTIVDYTLL